MKPEAKFEPCGFCSCQGQCTEDGFCAENRRGLNRFIGLVEPQRNMSYVVGGGDAIMFKQSLPLPEQAATPAGGLTTDSDARKGIPMFSGFVSYFPDAMADVARLSKSGNDKHNPGEPLHWSRGKSDDHADCIVRHQAEYQRIEKGFLHATMVAWRAMAQLQVELERLRKEGITYGASEPEKY